MKNTALNNRIVSMTQFDTDFLARIGAAYVAFGAAHSMLVKSISDASVNPKATQKKLMGRVAGKTLNHVDSVFVDIDSYEVNSESRVKLNYFMDKNGDIRFDLGQRSLRKVPSILSSQFKDLIDDRNKIAHSLVSDSEDGIIFAYYLQDDCKGMITSEFLNFFIERCDRFAHNISIYKQNKNEVQCNRRTPNENNSQN